MTIYLFTEDSATGKALQILAQKCLRERKKIAGIKFRHIPRGDIFNPRKIAAYIKNAVYEKEVKVLVCVDSECTDPKITSHNLLPCIKKLQGLCLSIQFIVVVHALETWLAADGEALQITLRAKKKIKIPGNLDSYCQPEKILQKTFTNLASVLLKARMTYLLRIMLTRKRLQVDLAVLKNFGNS